MAIETEKTRGEKKPKTFDLLVTRACRYRRNVDEETKSFQPGEELQKVSRNHAAILVNGKKAVRLDNEPAVREARQILAAAKRRTAPGAGSK